MCGLVGVVSVDSSRQTGMERTKAFKFMLYLDHLRGEDSTGVFFKDYAKTSSGNIIKIPVSSLYALKTKLFSSSLLDTKDCSVLMGHNRAATVGGTTLDNAHPFEHGNIVLAHNGTLKSRNGLTNNTFGTDSEAICYQLSNTDNPIEVLENLNGAYALTWYNREDNTFNICRNSERTLYYAPSEDGKYFAYASEMWMLMAANEKHPTLKLDMASADAVPTGKLFKINLSAPNITEGTTSTAFTVYTPPKTVVSYNSSRGTYARSRTVPGLPIQVGRGNSSYILFEVNSITTYGKSPQNLSYCINGTLVSNAPYSTQKYSVQCYTSDKKVISEIEDRNKKIVQGEVVSYFISTNSTMLTVAASSAVPLGGAAKFKRGKWNEYDSLWQSYCSSLEKSIGKEGENSQKKPNYSRPEEIDLAEDENWLASYSLGNETVMLPGPGGRNIPASRWYQLTKDGCGYCSSDISAIRADFVEWLGDSPICPECVDNTLTGDSSNVH